MWFKYMVIFRQMQTSHKQFRNWGNLRKQFRNWEIFRKIRVCVVIVQESNLRFFEQQFLMHKITTNGNLWTFYMSSPAKFDVYFHSCSSAQTREGQKIAEFVNKTWEMEAHVQFYWYLKIVYVSIMKYILQIYKHRNLKRRDAR